VTRLLLACLMLCVASPVWASPALVPMPRSITVGDGGFRIDAHTTIAVPANDPGALNAGQRLAELIGKTDGFVPRIGKSGTIRFVRRPGFAREGYRLDSDAAGATITASDDAGLFYGAVTLWQLNDGGRVPAVSIDDAPRFAWRGLLLDSARHFQTPAFIHRLIDAMAASKLNTLHWHLVDDQGWRIEIPKYPRLTSVSAWRIPASAPGAPTLPREGGFYTQAQIRELVAYAAKRNVTIVPEIEMPGHALSAIRAYPWLGMGVAIPRGTESDYGVFPWLYNTDERTFRFIEDVLDQVMALFPSRYVHVGGDEAVKDQWKASPAIQAQMKSLGIKTEDQLQSWFVQRIGTYLAKHDRRLVGWDEILDGGITPGATVMSWRGIEGAEAAAKAGHDTILSPMPTLYLDNQQGESAIDGPGRGNMMTLAKVYGFDPAPASIPAADRAHILGVQANMWTEHIRGDARAAEVAFPRAAALAELGWSPAATRDYPGFVRRLAPYMAKLRALGIVGSEAVYRPVAIADVAGAGARVTLSSQTDLPVRFTLDGSAPTASSLLYAGPITVPLPSRLRAASFLDERPLPGAIDLPLDALSVRRRDDTQLGLCTKAVVLRLEDDFPALGPRAAFRMDIFNPCWTYDAAPMDGVRSIAVTVGQIPFNFQIGADLKTLKFNPPRTAAGEIEVRDRCKGPLLAVLPLATAAANPGLTTLRAALPPLGGRHDLCLTYTSRGPDHLWGVASVQLIP